MATTSLSIARSIIYTSCSSVHHFSSSQPVAIKFPLRFGASSSTLSHRATHLCPISARNLLDSFEELDEEVQINIRIAVLIKKFTAMSYERAHRGDSDFPSKFKEGETPKDEEEEVPINYEHITKLIKTIRTMARVTKELIEGLPSKFKMEKISL